VLEECVFEIQGVNMSLWELEYLKVVLLVTFKPFFLCWCYPVNRSTIAQPRYDLYMITLPSYHIGLINIYTGISSMTTLDL